MAIANIKSDVVRRTVIIVSFPILIPLGFLMFVGAAVLEFATELPGDIRSAWRGCR